ncbi:hypothetical protein TWF481_006533 [Arthrobotrys musiformis]|uniref:F-box domain-containing protein n=1 Tax=Arthrobotrys musiformis TaxID=47236 RepID=A0AAV9W9R8_9PEZI
MSICDLPPEIHSSILSYLVDIDDEIAATETFSLWRRLLFTKASRGRRYVPSDDPRSPLPPIHKLLATGHRFRLSCTVRYGNVESYRLLFIPPEAEENYFSNYGTKDISTSWFLDEPPLGLAVSRGEGSEEPLQTGPGIQGSMYLIDRTGVIGLQRIECQNITTIKELITVFVKNAQSHMNGAGVRTDLLQEVVFSLNEVTRLDWRTLTLILNHILVGKVIKRSAEEHREWLKLDSNALPEEEAGT